MGYQCEKGGIGRGKRVKEQKKTQSHIRIARALLRRRNESNQANVGIRGNASS